MCSTPFGITEVGTLKTSRLFSGCAGAQRLSASQRSAPEAEPETTLPFACSTPFGITEVGTSTHSRRPTPSGRCSTPFGITEVGTPRCIGNLPALRMCSTPFGITEVGTSRSMWRRTSHTWCSTPFGITEVGTRGEVSRNAPVNCAQRLSASQRSARDHAVRDARPRGVLNAFRHHRGRHMCPSSNRSRQSPVLNAFRHHRGRHASSQCVSIATRRCSTPFGITEVGTRAKSFRLLALSSAQRLSASQRSAQRTADTSA